MATGTSRLQIPLTPRPSTLCLLLPSAISFYFPFCLDKDDSGFPFARSLTLDRTDLFPLMWTCGCNMCLRGCARFDLSQRKMCTDTRKYTLKGAARSLSTQLHRGQKKVNVHKRRGVTVWLGPVQCHLRVTGAQMKFCKWPIGAHPSCM